jgi:hypothetical protein
MQGMETLRCPTCVALLPDPEARRCPLCHTKLRKKRRGRAIVLGESNRLSGRSLPVDVELHVRAEERFLPDEKQLEEIVHDPANLPPPSAPRDPAEPVFSFAPLAEAPPQPVEAVLAFAAAAPAMEPVVESAVEPETLVETETAAEPAVEPETKAEPEPDIDLTAEARPEPALDLTNGTVTPPPEAAGANPRPKSNWQAVPARGASPLDGNLNDIVGELHRKAREDTEDHRTR